MARRSRRAFPSAAQPTAPPAALAGLARIRANRVRPPRDLSLRRDMDFALADITRLRRNVSSIAAAWQATIPAALLPRTRLTSLSRAQLTVAVPDAATRFELDRFLRAGGFAALAQACPANLTKVRITLA
jgi:hypothetical protein